MSDIVERLKELEAVEGELACECDCSPEATANYRYAMTCAEAADTITSLREEVERLKADLAFADEQAAKVEAVLWPSAEQAEALRAEVERLRAALETVLAGKGDPVLVAHVALHGNPRSLLTQGEGKPIKSGDRRYNNAERIFGDD